MGQSRKLNEAKVPTTTGSDPRKGERIATKGTKIEVSQANIDFSEAVHRALKGKISF